jgi:tetratricopeptide (TPR) repeat protein
MNRATRPSIERGIELFSEAIRLDPQNAHALAGLATAHALLAGGRSDTPQATAAEARRAASAALAIDPQLAEPHAVLAEMAFLFDWDWPAAEQRFRQALALNPSFEYARERYSMFLAARDRLDEALVEMGEARRVNPTSAGLIAATGALLRYARRYPEAVIEYERALALNPEHEGANVGLGRLYNATNRFEEAVARFSPILASQPGHTFVEAEIAQALAALGRRDEVLWLKVDSRPDPLRHDPRFEALIQRLDRP